MEEKPLEVTLELQGGYRFLVDFHQDGVPPLLVDEPPPLGEGAGPGASRVLLAAIANCLSASALYCLRKARIEVKAMHAHASASLTRNDQGRLRIGQVRARLEPVVAAGDEPRMRRCLELFEDFCTVTQSVRGGIDVEVQVEPRASG